MKKRFFAVVLTLAMLLPMVLSLGTVAGAEEITAKPFYGLTWSAVDMELFGNLEDAPRMVVSKSNGAIVLSSSSDPVAYATKMKATMDALPEGMRHLRIFRTALALKTDAEDVIFLDNGADQLKKEFTAFIEAYYAIGGKLDGVILDTEYTALGSYYIYSDNYKGGNQNIYNDIVENPRYATEIRPLLVERGFKFYSNPSGYKSEIYSIYPNLSAEQYADCQKIWNTVMYNRISQYLTEAIYEPAAARYPDVVCSDYQRSDTYAWNKSLGAEGEQSYLGGNSLKTGNVSNAVIYFGVPNLTFFTKDNVALYQKPYGYYKANFEDDPYNMLLWNINKFKNIYAATDTEKFSAWISNYDYSSRAGSVCNTAYYSEMLLHIGLLDPQPFLVYMNGDAVKYTGTQGRIEYNKRMQVISEILNELTRLAGYSDRKPIETPASWNNGFVLSGIYANGRNLWRLTPDTTDGMTLESFKINGEEPTFSINGNTITFPQGTIIADGEVSVVGTSGYWIETPKDVTPVITRDADYFSKYPSFAEDFEGYAAGTVLTAAIAKPAQAWYVAATNDLLVTAQGDGQALALTGTATVNNGKLPKNITAGDSYAKQQAWEASFTLPEAMNSGASVKLLAANGDGGIKLEGDKVYYDVDRTYQEMAGVTLTAGQKYTVKREVNFTVAGAYTCSYTVYDASGTVLGQASNVAMRSNMVLPLATIGFSCADLTTTVLIDDYKVYPTGAAKDFEVYNAQTGIQLNGAEKTDAASVAYRLSWMNATGERKEVTVKAAYYDASGATISTDTIATVEMAPGADGVVTGIVENTTGKVVVYLDDPDSPPTNEPTDSTESTTPSGTQAPTDPVDPSEPGLDKGIGGDTIVLIVVAVLVLAGAGVAVFFYLKKKKPTESASTEE